MTNREAQWGKQKEQIGDAKYYNIVEQKQNRWYFEINIGETDCIFLNAKSCKKGPIPDLLFAHPRSLQYKTELLEDTVNYCDKNLFLSDITFRMNDLDPMTRRLTANLSGVIDRGWFRKARFEIDVEYKFDGIMFFGEDRAALVDEAEKFLNKHDSDLTLDVCDVRSGHKVTLRYDNNGDS